MDRTSCKAYLKQQDSLKNGDYLIKPMKFGTLTISDRQLSLPAIHCTVMAAAMTGATPT